MIKACTHVSSPYPTLSPAVTQRGYIQEYYKAGQRGAEAGYFTVIMLQPQGCPWTHNEADIH